MDKKLFRLGMKYHFAGILLFIGAAIGLLLSLLISLGDGEGELHSMTTAMCGFATVIAAILLTTELFAVATAFNRSRGTLLKTLGVLFVLYSAFASALTLGLEFLLSKLFSHGDFDYQFRPMLQNFGVSHSACTGFPGIIAGFVFQVLFFLMLALGGMFIFGLFRRLPPKLGLAAWILFIFGCNCFTLFGNEMAGLELDLGVSLRLGLYACLLVLFGVGGSYCIKTCSAEPRSAVNANS
ncbi:MAG: hypothetical protein IJ746_02520 [Ruminococcus sp.]|nr:hypothetical protein [Ruminococcus sp.]